MNCSIKIKDLKSQEEFIQISKLMKDCTPDFSFTFSKSGLEINRLFRNSVSIINVIMNKNISVIHYNKQFLMIISKFKRILYPDIFKNIFRYLFISKPSNIEIDSVQLFYMMDKITSKTKQLKCSGELSLYYDLQENDQLNIKFHSTKYVSMNKLPVLDFSSHYDAYLDYKKPYDSYIAIDFHLFIEILRESEKIKQKKHLQYFDQYFDIECNSPNEFSFTIINSTSSSSNNQTIKYVFNLKNKKRTIYYRNGLMETNEIYTDEQPKFSMEVNSISKINQRYDLERFLQLLFFYKKYRLSPVDGYVYLSIIDNFPLHIKYNLHIGTLNFWHASYDST